MEEAYKDADVIYAKSWGPFITTEDPEEGNAFKINTRIGTSMTI